MIFRFLWKHARLIPGCFWEGPKWGEGTVLIGWGSKWHGKRGGN